VAIFAAGWLFLFIVLLAVPDRGTRRPANADDAAPAVVSLLAGKLGNLGFGATLVDLAIGGWFRVIPPGGPTGPAMCVVPAEAPAGTLAPRAGGGAAGGRAAAGQRRGRTVAGRGRGLPDPAGLMTQDEAAAVLGGPVRGKHADGPAGRTMTWQPARTTMPILRVLVRQADGGRPVPPAARPVPGAADGYLLGQGATLTVTPLTVVVSISGRVPAGAEGVLAGLLPQVEARLRQQVARLATGSPLLLILINIDPS